MNSNELTIDRSRESGMALVMALMLLAVLMTMLTGYFSLSQIGMTTTKSTMNSVEGLYAAEAGLNIRAETIRQIFEGYQRPAGASPNDTDACAGGNDGSGDMACVQHQLVGEASTTYVVEDTANPTMIVVPRGEVYQNLNAQEYGYRVESVAADHEGRTSAILSMDFKSRLIPLFQFAAFYNKDLEILPGPAMLLEGPVHVNGDLYLGAGASLDIEGQVTTSGALWRGRKNTDTCMPGAVRVADPAVLTELPGCSGGRELLLQSDLDAWNGMVETGVDLVTVPPPEALDPVPGEIYWDNAEVRIMLNLNDATPVVEVRDPDGSVNAFDTAALNGCAAVGFTTSSNGTSGDFYNHREATYIEMLEVDATALLDCLHTTTIMGFGKDIDETSQGGLVWYFGVDGPDSDTVNNYGVRVTNGGTLAATVFGAPEIAGLTVVTDQAVYVEGDYNADQKKPAAFLADSLNVLSNDWDDDNSALSIGSRLATDTVINAAFMAGTDTTGYVDEFNDGEGVSGQGGAYNGGLENYPRFHERWTGDTLTYRGSFVSLNRPRHVDGLWGDQSYNPPNRDWRYDTDFDDAANLPPLSPRFVYLRQMLFQRRFDL